METLGKVDPFEVPPVDRRVSWSPHLPEDTLIISETPKENVGSLPNHGLHQKLVASEEYAKRTPLLPKDQEQQ